VVHALWKTGGSISEQMDLESKGIYVDERSLSGSGFRAGLSLGCMDFGQR
jgi:hypothetical protein